MTSESTEEQDINAHEAMAAFEITRVPVDYFTATIATLI